jgi:hypothetical protein
MCHTMPGPNRLRLQHLLHFSPVGALIDVPEAGRRCSEADHLTPDETRGAGPDAEQDVSAAREYLQADPRISPDRIGVFGGNYSTDSKTGASPPRAAGHVMAVLSDALD